MKGKESSTAGTGRPGTAQTHAASFAKVFDGRKQPIRGLWERNGRFYAQLKVENSITGIKKTRRVPLLDKDRNPVTTVAQAIAELNRLRTQRADNTLPVLGRTPKFGDYAARYLDAISAGVGEKKRATIDKERRILARWADAIGGLRLDQIKRLHVNRHVEARLKSGAKPRTVNLDVIALRVVLKRALEEGLIQRLPTEGLRPLKTTTPKRALVSSADLDALCKAALTASKNGQQLSDYIRLMAYCGARRNEALALRWSDVDFAQEQLTIGAAGDTKNQTSRVVDFNPRLAAHLRDMATRRQPDSEYLFPSPQRGDNDTPAKSLRDSLDLARLAAKLPGFRFHDCRHHFISMSVMAGVDFLTVAAWVGHRDGGVLIGKVYAHLANEHRKLMAQRLVFEPQIVGAQNAAG
jgi:integrase